MDIVLLRMACMVALDLRKETREHGIAVRETLRVNDHHILFSMASVGFVRLRHGIDKVSIRVKLRKVAEVVRLSYPMLRFQRHHRPGIELLIFKLASPLSFLHHVWARGFRV